MNSSNAEWLVIDAGVGYALSVMDAETSSLRADVTANVRRVSDVLH